MDPETAERPSAASPGSEAAPPALSRAAVEDGASSLHEHFNLALDVARAGSWEWFLASNENRWSDSLWALYNLSPGACQPSYQAWRDSVLPEDLPQVEHLLARAVAQGESFELQWRVAGLPGERWLMARGHPLRDAAGGLARYIGIVLDITEHKKLEQAGQARESELRNILDALPIMVAYLGQDDRYVLANREYERNMGLSPGQIRGKTIAELIGAEADARARPFRQRVKRGERVAFENFVKFADGNLHELAVNFAPDLDPGGEYRGCLVTVMDLTETRRTEAELHWLRAELERSSRRMIAIQTVAAVAHDLNQPLNAAATFAESARRLYGRDAPGPQVRDALERVNQEIQRAGDTLRELMTSLQPTTALPAMRADLNSVVFHAVELSRQEKSLPPEAFHLNLSPYPLPVAIDALVIEKIVLNLLRNAGEALAHAGVAVPAIRIGTRTDDGMGIIEVADNGPGVRPEQLPELFQPLRSTKPGGIGMGLAISRGIAELHGGRLWHEARSGGATFCCALPLAR